MFGKRNDINEKYILKLFGYKFRKKKGNNSNIDSKPDKLVDIWYEVATVGYRGEPLSTIKKARVLASKVKDFLSSVNGGLVRMKAVEEISNVW
jgi:hypothetical protein